MNLRFDWRQVRLFVTATACLVASALTLSVRAQQIVSQPVVQAAWPAFGADFQPSWDGETKRVDFRVGNTSGINNSNVTVWGVVVTPPPPPIATPIGLVDSVRDYSVMTSATVQGVAANAQGELDYGGRSALPYVAKIAKYAQVLNLQDILLAQGNGTAEQSGVLRDDSLEGKGRLSAYSLVHSEALGAATASAVSKNKLSATYRVSSPVRFTLSGSLAGAGEFSLGASLVDQFGVSLYSFNPAMTAYGRSWAFGLSGILRPGDYTIAVTGEAHNGNNAISPLDIYKGGMGEYTLSFHAAPIMAGDFDNNGVVSGSDLSRWRSDFGMGASGEADFDGDTDGSDFLAWQRLLGTHASGAAAAIPEPCTGLLGLASVFGMAALGRRT